MTAFLDANALIYLVEGAPSLARRVRDALRALETYDAPLRIAMSTLSRLECRIAPMRAGDARTLAIYDHFFARPDVQLVQLSVVVVDLATAIRARHGLKTPDALQAACCLQLGPSHVFVTGDRAFLRVSGLRVSLLE